VGVNWKSKKHKTKDVLDEPHSWLIVTVNKMKRLLKKVVVTIGLVIIGLGAFLAGGIAYKFNQYQKIPRATYFLNLFEQTHFYPPPLQDNVPVFETKDLTYPYSCIAYGDSWELAFYEKTALISNVISEKPSFVIHLGDMVYCGDPHQWENFDFSDGNIIKSGIPLFPVLANHEYRSQKKWYPPLQYYFDRFKFPKNKRWYSFTFDNSVFLILDTNTDYSPGSEQYRWLMDMLKKMHRDFYLSRAITSLIARGIITTMRKNL
jgi:hypothetical protein